MPWKSSIFSDWTHFSLSSSVRAGTAWAHIWLISFKNSKRSIERRKTYTRAIHSKDEEKNTKFNQKPVLEQNINRNSVWVVFFSVWTYSTTVAKERKRRKKQIIEKLLSSPTKILDKNILLLFLCSISCAFCVVFVITNLFCSMLFWLVLY